MRGSARSVPDLIYMKLFMPAGNIWLGYGGHFAAAGMTLEIDKVDAFRNKFEEVIAATMPLHLTTPEILIDSEISFKDITPAFYNIICLMEPFGPENVRPTFVVRKAIDSGFSRIVKEEHLRFSVRQDGVTLTGIGLEWPISIPCFPKMQILFLKLMRTNGTDRKTCKWKL